MINIATLLTCHNRKEKTISCIKCLFAARDFYNANNHDHISIEIFLTDDGCTDGTSDAVKSLFASEQINIIQGDGNLYWAGGMRLAWRTAIAKTAMWDFYLLINDDTYVLNNVFSNLFACHNHALKRRKNVGIYSGITSASDNQNKITYGGDVFMSKAKMKTRRLNPTGIPQIADLITANILLVPNEVVDKVGIFHEGYIHSGADNDYSVMARKHGYMSYVTPEVCGKCDNDHSYDADECLMLMKMSLSERKKYVYQPTRSDKDYLLLIRRAIPIKYPISWLVRKLRLYFPSIYYKLNKTRGYYV